MLPNSKTNGKPGSGFYALFLFIGIMLLLVSSPKPAQATLSINTSKPTDWVITNGTLKLDWISTTGRLSGVYLNGVNITDTTNRNAGVYMDNTGSFGGGPATVGYKQDGNSYIDWWVVYPASATNAFSFSEHFILTDNDTGFSVYCLVNHAATDPTGGMGQIQYVFRINGNYFNNAYYYDVALNLLGPTVFPLPNIPASAGADPGRNVQNAVLDLGGIPQPPGWTRQFDTKYNRCTYQYLHQADGAYGSTYGIWTVLPSKETLPGGPTHQCLDSEGLLIMECLSGHLDNPLTFSAVTGTALSHFWGPFYFHLNKFSPTLNTPYKLYQDAVAAGAKVKAAYQHDTVLASIGYIPQSQRGTVAPVIAGAGTTSPNTGWVVLSDPKTNTQLSDLGFQYWTSENTTGTAAIKDVAPGTYRLSTYVLGQWGEMRNDNITVNAGQTITPKLTFVPENFSTAPSIWTIGSPDRSAHEFFRGHAAGTHAQDDREYQGTWNYWADLADNNGACVYNATNGPGYKATNNLEKWYYLQWLSFDPGEFGGIYNAADDTTDGYKYIMPAYAAAMETTPGNPGSAPCPPWTIHFTCTPAQMAQGKYAVLSIALAATEGDPQPSLNGHQLTWHAGNRADADVRSGLSAYTEWGAFQWDASALKPAGQDNVLTMYINTRSVMYDALRFEITNTSADPNVRGWHDYQYIYGRTETYPNDGIANP